jgi:phenylacetate-CoA ligase
VQAIYDPEVETREPEAQRDLDARQYRRQIRYLFENSAFYRDKFRAAGYATPEAVGDIADIAQLPFTVKDELRASQAQEPPLGRHAAAPWSQIVRVFSTSGTTGTPAYIPLTARDVTSWMTISARSYSACGIRAGDRLISTYGAGPFVAGLSLDTFNKIGLCHIPVGAGNTERLVRALQLIKPEGLACTPSYAGYIAEWARERGFDVREAGLKYIMVAGEPGGGEEQMRARLEGAYGAQVTETMGIGDMSVSLWGECGEQHGMHFGGRGFVHFELIDPETGEPVPLTDGATGELVYTALDREAAPLVRFRSRDHVVVWTGPCACGRTSPRVRCIGRTDDMLIVRGVNVFPSAVREIVNQFAPVVSGVISIRPSQHGVKQTPPLKVVVEMAEGEAIDPALAQRIQERLRAALVVGTDIQLVVHGTLPRTDYKSKLVDFSEAKKA